MNNKKIKFRYIFVMMIIFLYTLMLITRIIAFPTFAYKAYFKIHKKDFEKIIDYMESTNQSVYCYKDFNGELHKSSIADSETDKSLRKIYGSIMFENIHGEFNSSDNHYSKNITVSFDTDFFVSFNGMPYEICYSSNKPYSDYTYFSRYYEIIKYEEIPNENNWYIAFKYTKQGSVG